MSIEQEIAGLTQSTTDLLGAVNTKKATLDSAVSNAQTAVVDATSQVSLAAAEKVGAQDARDTAESFKDQAYTYSQSAASAVAYQDLTAIAQTKAETAVDVFVYDTRKDSDGGAWRKRTQGTSWYNETLNTSTRGSRKEFPAVAVITVLDSGDGNQVRIYDGDDPSLPLWMLITDTTGGAGHIGSKSCASALNGKILFGVNTLQGLRGLDFASDKIFGYKESVTAGASGVSPNPISLRNQTIDVNAWSKGYPALVNADVNDVAMTVLPNAPIDPATGLPIPTIAVATDGGVSVIKDDGTVVDIAMTAADYNYATQCAFYGKRLAFMFSYKNLAADSFYHIVDIPSTDISVPFSLPVSELNGEYYNKLSSGHIPPLPVTSGYAGNLENTEITEKAIGSDYGFMPFDRLPENQEQGSISIITSTYNTGWMNGDIKLATLSDTDDTDLVESGINDNFTGYVDQAAATAAGYSFLNSVTFNAASDAVVWGGVSEGQFQFDVAAGFTNGEAVIVEVVVSGATKGSLVFQNNFATVPLLNTGGNIGTVAGTYIFALTKVGGLRFASAGTFDGQIDNISVRLAEADRSVNGNGLQVFGTVTKEPVATGADLVAYSGFSPTNYLMQPYNSDLDFGTGDFCIMGWFKDTPSTTASDYVLYRRQANFVGAQLTLQIDSSHLINFVASGGVTLTSQSSVRTDGWVHICAIRDGGVVRLYINSALEASGSNLQSVSNEGAYLVLGGASIDGATATSLINTGSLALWRISATAPTAEQIAKIYRDEKPLFQENAQATLHGTSDAVTALAYDTDTTLLHVGTSSGRSVFQGLRRVDNTTDAVGTAISASNNLIVEE